MGKTPFASSPGPVAVGASGLSFLLLLAVLSVGSVRAQEAKDGAARADIDWSGDVADAFLRAKKEKKPVLWVIMKDKEIACTRMMGRVYKEAKVVARMKDLVVLPCSVNLHEKTTALKDGKEVDSCPQFLGVSCAAHQTIEREMRARYESGEEVVAPQHILCDPDGKVLERQRYEMAADVLLDFIDKGLKAFRGEPAAPPAAAGGAPAPAAGPAEVSPEQRRMLNRLTTAPEEERLLAAREIVRSAEKPAIKEMADLLHGNAVTPEEMRAAIIRTLGRTECSGAAPELTILLDLKNTHLRNCALVTLEEMANPVAAEAILELWKREKDPHVRKDILRALGPAGAGNEAARGLLLEQLKGKEESLRIASAIGLGSHLVGREDVRTALKERWKKEPGNQDLKIAILYAYYLSKDDAVIEDIDALMANEKNGEIEQLAGIVKTSLGGGGGAAPDPGRGGGGRGGRGGFGRGGPMMALYRALGRLFADDKIERNVVKEFRDRGRRQ